MHGSTVLEAWRRKKKVCCTAQYHSSLVHPNLVQSHECHTKVTAVFVVGERPRRTVEVEAHRGGHVLAERCCVQPVRVGVASHVNG